MPAAYAATVSLQWRPTVFALLMLPIFFIADAISGLLWKGQDLPGVNLRTLTAFGIFMLGAVALRRVVLHVR